MASCKCTSFCKLARVAGSANYNAAVRDDRRPYKRGRFRRLHVTQGPREEGRDLFRSQMEKAIKDNRKREIAIINRGRRIRQGR